MIAVHRATGSNLLLSSKYLVRNEGRERILSILRTEVISHSLPIHSGFLRNFTTLPEPRDRYAYTLNQLFRIHLCHDTSKSPKCLLHTSAFVRFSDIFERKSYPKQGGKDKAEVAKERETLNKYKDDSPQIMLIEEEGKYIPITLKQAERMAKRRDLKLVQVEDPTMTGKSKKPVYKLITGKEYHEISMAKKASKPTSGIKGEKVLSVNGTIADNDLKGKLHNVEKWLKKGYQTKVTIAARGASKEQLGSVFAKVEEEVATMNGRILQHREKFGDIKFYIAPPKAEKKIEKKQRSDSSENTVNEKE